MEMGTTEVKQVARAGSNWIAAGESRKRNLSRITAEEGAEAQKCSNQLTTRSAPVVAAPLLPFLNQVAAILSAQTLKDKQFPRCTPDLFH